MELEPHRQALLRLGLRMLGDRQSAEDLVQDTFVRAIERPPNDTSRSVKPWLYKVASNLAKDRLRARKRIGYRGPWLPPVEFLANDDRPDARVIAKDEIHYALLVALEALSENERAVWTLRLGLLQSTKESAQALDLSEANVKVLFHRAKKKLEHASAPCELASAQVVVGELVNALLTQNREAALELLRKDCQSAADANNKYRAASKCVYGRENVVSLFLGTLRKGPSFEHFAFGEVRGTPALFYKSIQRDSRDTPQGVLVFDIDETRSVRAIYHAMADKVR